MAIDDAGKHLAFLDVGGRYLDDRDAVLANLKQLDLLSILGRGGVAFPIEEEDVPALRVPEDVGCIEQIVQGSFLLNTNLSSK